MNWWGFERPYMAAIGSAKNQIRLLPPKALCKDIGPGVGLVRVEFSLPIA
jgi:hypothetical protein